MMPSPTADLLKQQLHASMPQSASNRKTVIVGLYGVPGSGKSFLLAQLKQELEQLNFTFHEGSEMISNVVPGGLEAFHNAEESEKIHWRRIAMDTIRATSIDSGKVVIVAGHLMFWPKEEEPGQPVYTQTDFEVFTHILYLDVPVEVVVQRRLDDIKKGRPSASVTHLDKWQQAEKALLRQLCRDHGILFSLISPHQIPNKVLTLLHDFQNHTEEFNLRQAEAKLNKILTASKDRLETVLVLDADKTLAAEDAGVLFWKTVIDSQRPGDKDCLKTLFSSPLGYSYTAFRQATLLYEESADDQEFDAFCDDVASAVTMYPEFVSLLNLVAEHDYVGAVIITCGLRRVWEKVVEKKGLAEKVQVIGGGRIADGFVVTAAVKAALVAHLQNTHHIYVFAFGDSPLDLEMLCKADQAVVVVGEEQNRSKMMDVDLFNLIYDGSLLAWQVLLPSDTSPRLDTEKLPIIQLMSQDFINLVLLRRNRQRADIQVVHATDRNVGKLLMTPMRDAKNAGPNLREAHRRVGWYLATEFLTDVIGIEEYSIPHVQGHHTNGYRLLNEKQTLIIPLMRGGEAMAFGVNDAFPLAMFVHAGDPKDILLHHVQGCYTVVLVDSVMNSGKTMVQFVEHIRQLHGTIRIVVVVGVAQAQSVAAGGPIQALSHVGLSLVALRLSDNKFTGQGNTDTGNRLFNTTHLL